MKVYKKDKKERNKNLNLSKSKKSKYYSKKEKFKKVEIEKNISKIDLFENKSLIFIIISISVFIFIIIYAFFKLFLESSSNVSNVKINKFGKDYTIDSFNDENLFKIVQEFITINTNGTFLYDYKKFKKMENPKISVIITVYNGEAFIKNGVRSVQNQDFHDIEIIIVEDKSEDKSIQIIKELMNEDPRIILIENEENRGILFSIVKGVLNAKGKYIKTIDVDDFLSCENSLSIMYKAIEKYNLDIIGYGATQGNLDMNTYTYTHTSFHNYLETSIIYQPELSEKAYKKDINGNIIGVGDVLWTYFFKRELFIEAIREIDEKYIMSINNIANDIFLFFILTKKAKSLKFIKKYLYVTIHDKISDNSAVNNFYEKKMMVREKYTCQNYLSYIEFVFSKSNNDLKLASFAIEYFFLNNECRGDIKIRDEAIRICKLFLVNQYIEQELKDKINSYLNE